MPGFLAGMRSRICFVAASLFVLTLGVLAQTPARDTTSSEREDVRAPGKTAPELKPGTLSQEQIRDLMRRVADKDLENEKRSHDYTYIQRQEEHKLDGDGQVKSTETKTYE